MEELVSRFKSLLEQAHDMANIMESPRLHDIISRLHSLVDEMDDVSPDGYFDQYIAAKDEVVRLRAWVVAMQHSGLGNGLREMMEKAMSGEMPPPDRPWR